MLELGFDFVDLEVNGGGFSIGTGSFFFEAWAEFLWKRCGGRFGRDS